MHIIYYQHTLHKYMHTLITTTTTRTHHYSGQLDRQPCHQPRVAALLAQRGLDDICAGKVTDRRYKRQVKVSDRRYKRHVKVSDRCYKSQQ